MRVLVVAVPVLVALAIAVLVALLLPRGSGATALLWWVAVLGSSTAALLLTDRLARRALPLAVLLELSLVFPDEAPSRLRAARTGSVSQLERTLDRMRQKGAGGEAVEAAETLVVLVGVLGLHDKRTRGHSERVRALTDLLTCELGLDEDERARVRWASLVHDLGKLRVPVTVLNGGRELAEEEWEALRRHPEEGQRLAAGFVPWLGEWGRTIVEHHERWDGGGYPRGLAGEQISYGARIVAVADSFEVMTAHRSYAPARSAGAARAELARCAGTQFDPEIVRAFLGISVRKLSWVLGPVTWAAQVPLLTTVDRAGQAVKVASVTALVAGVLSAGWVTSPQFSPWDAGNADAGTGRVSAGESASGSGSGAGAGRRGAPGAAGGVGDPGPGGTGAGDVRLDSSISEVGSIGGMSGADLAVSPTERQRDAAAAARAPRPAGEPGTAGGTTGGTSPGGPTVAAADGAGPGGAPGAAQPPVLGPPAPAAAPAPAPAPAPGPAEPEPDPAASPATRAAPGEPGTPASPATPAEPGQRPQPRS